MISGACAVIGLICGFAAGMLCALREPSWNLRSPFRGSEPASGGREASLSAGSNGCNHRWKLTKGRECMKCGDMCLATDFADDSEAVRGEWGGHLPGAGTGITFDPAGVSVRMEDLVSPDIYVEDGCLKIKTDSSLNLDDPIGDEPETYPPPTPEQYAELREWANKTAERYYRQCEVPESSGIDGEQFSEYAECMRAFSEMGRRHGWEFYKRQNAALMEALNTSWTYPAKEVSDSAGVTR